MAEHWLKTWPHFFDAIKRGEKRFEYRSEDDRDFAAGDVLVLCKWDPQPSLDTEDTGQYVCDENERSPSAYDAAQLRARVTHILHGGRFGVPVGYCVMSIEVMRDSHIDDGGDPKKCATASATPKSPKEQ